jgi:hypothetical protein
MITVFPHRVVALLLVTALAANVIVRGIAPASTVITSDFPNYFTAAKIVADRGDIERLYDIPWFQEQMRHYQVGMAEGRFSPFPPPTALLLVPLTPLAPLTALRVLTAVNVLCLIGSIVLLARALAWSTLDAAVLVLLSGSAILGALRLGQPYMVVSASCILGYYAYLRDKPVLAGACFGAFTPIKYFPLIFLVYFAFRKQWQLVAGGAVTILAIVLVSVAMLGWSIHEQFLTSVLGNHLDADLSYPFSAQYQSFDTLYRRLFMYDARRNPEPLMVAPVLAGVARLVTKAGILLAAIVTVIRQARVCRATATAASIGLLGIVTLLLAPATASYHLVLLWLPVALLVDTFMRAGSRRCAYLLLGCYALSGFFSYTWTAPFEGRGGLTVLAYPRLLLLLTMFAVSVRCLWRMRVEHDAMQGGDVSDGVKR